MKKYRYLIYSLIVFSQFLACEKDYIKSDNAEETVSADSTGSVQDTSVNEDEDDYVYTIDGVVMITLNGNTITADTSGVTVSGSTITITSAGTYNITGSLTDGKVIVDTQDEEDVKLILSNVNISCSTSAPLFVKDAEKVIIVLADSSENYFADGSYYQDLVDNEPNATIFSKSDLTIFGDGSLFVTANYNDGISSKDGLIITSGIININANDDGIRGKDYLIIHDGSFTVVAGGDGLTSDIETNSELGYISIDRGTYSITSGGDGISAQTVVEINDGEFSITSGGGSSRSVSGSTSAKGIKGLTSVVINGGTISLDAADDGIHSDSGIEINGGNQYISSGDDGVHADESISISNSEIEIAKSYEGIESANITVEASNVKIVADDDGFNATQGSRTEHNDNSHLNIKSGYVCVNSSNGDALDSNGNITISGGTVLAHGPSSNPEVGMDYNGTCKVTGGLLVISGTSSNMTQAPSTSSTQYSVLVKFTNTLSANSIVHIQDSEGNDLLTFAPYRKYQSVVLSSSDLILGDTYTVYTGGNSTGSYADGLYSGGVYSGGTVYESFTISGIVTTIGTSSGDPGGPGRPGG